MLLAVALPSLLGLRPVAAQSSGDNRTVTVNYVYASQLGIGTYDVGGLSVDVYTLPLGLDWNFSKDLDLEAPIRESRDWALEFNFPVSYGFYHLDTSDPVYGHVDVRQQTIALVPGLALRAPVTDQWRLRPFADFGFGSVVTTQGAPPPDNRFFLIYTAGITSLYEIPFGDDKQYTFALGNGLTFAGNSDVSADIFTENYWSVETGVELRRSLGFDLADLGIGNSDAGIGKLAPELGGYFIHYYFPNPLTFTRYLNTPLEVDNQFEFGATLGSATDWELLTIRNPKIGASYIFGDGLEVFRVNFGFPF